jgi:hypothetical protein
MTEGDNVFQMKLLVDLYQVVPSTELENLIFILLRKVRLMLISTS